MPMARVAQTPGASAGSSWRSGVLWSLRPLAQVLVPPVLLIPVPMACRAQPERALQCCVLDTATAKC